MIELLKITIMLQVIANAATPAPVTNLSAHRENDKNEVEKFLLFPVRNPKFFKNVNKLVDRSKSSPNMIRRPGLDIKPTSDA